MEKWKNKFLKLQHDSADTQPVGGQGGGEKGEKEETKMVRFRTLGCYPLSGAVESEAESLEDIVLEMLTARTSERAGRLIDFYEAGSMEKKKREGYF